MPGAYDSPAYYEIAFSYRDIPAEVDVFEECIRRFSRIAVKSVFELGCGTSPHMGELVKRGYRYGGLDLNRPMLEFSRQKALRIGTSANLVHGDMVSFTLKEKVDFIYVLLGSLYVKTASELRTHLDSVVRALRRGGLYLLDWCIQFEPPGRTKHRQRWRIERGGIQTETTVSWKSLDRTAQTYEEEILLKVNDRGKELSFISRAIRKAVYPQEFLCHLAGSEHLEFVGWWNNWDLAQPLEQAAKIDRPIVVVRKV